MLTIRSQQMQALSEYMQANFEDRLIRHISEDFPEEFKKMGGSEENDAPVREFVKKGCSKATSYGISTERDISRFIDLMLRFGEGFETLDSMEWTVPILNDETLIGRGKIDLIYQQLPPNTSEDR